MSDPQDVAEAFDADKLDDDRDYGEDDLGSYPPDRPSGVGPMAMTPAEEAFPEPEGLRAWREEPDPLADELDRRADQLDEEERRHLAEGPDGIDELATEDERLAEDPELGDLDLGPEPDVDGLADTSPLVGDDEATLIGEEVGGSEGERPAEEQAIHIAGEPPLRAGDSYLDDEA